MSPVLTRCPCINCAGPTRHQLERSESYQTEVRGERCGSHATIDVTEGGRTIRLCFVHASVVRLGLGSLDDVLEGRRQLD